MLRSENEIEGGDAENKYKTKLKTKVEVGRDNFKWLRWKISILQNKN